MMEAGGEGAECLQAPLGGHVSQMLALVLMGDFNLTDVRCKYNTAERKQSRRFLEHVEKLPDTAGE